jgi:hypothetical protein
MWSQDDILYAIIEWEEERGKPPVANDWLTAGEKNPSAVTVYKKFGSWNEAIRAAGFTPYAYPRKEFDEKLARRLRKEGLSEKSIASRLEISTDVLRKRLGPRPKLVPVGKKRTREQRIADLQKAIADEQS